MTQTEPGIATPRPAFLCPLVHGVGRAARHLPPSALPIAALLAGSMLPPTLHAATAAVPAALSCSVLLGAVALPTLDASARARSVLPAAIPAVLALALLGPALTALACALAGSLGLTRPGDLEWATLAAAAPVGIGAVVTARTLGLDQRRMAALMILSTLAVPLVLPELAWLLGFTGGAGARTLAVLVAETSGLPLLAGLALRRIPAMRTPRIRLAAAQGSLAALMLMGLLRGIGLGSAVAVDVPDAIRSAGTALVVALCGAAATWLVLRRWPDALLAGVFRSNTVIWASLASVSNERAALLMALSTLAGYAAPVLARLALGRPCPHPRPAVTSSAR